jgi:hypothetical protein
MVGFSLSALFAHLPAVDEGDWHGGSTPVADRLQAGFGPECGDQSSNISFFSLLLLAIFYGAAGGSAGPRTRRFLA